MYFPTNIQLTESLCYQLLQELRWRGNPLCPYCKSTASSKTEINRLHCNTCNTTYSVTVKTIFHKTRISLDKWFVMIYLRLQQGEDLTVRQWAQLLGVHKNTAHRMSLRITASLATPKQRQLLWNIVNALNSFEYIEAKGEFDDNRGLR